MVLRAKRRQREKLRDKTVVIIIRARLVLPRLEVSWSALTDLIFIQVTTVVLNEGAVIIRRPGRAETSSSESEEEEVAPQEPEEVKPEEPPPRDPLEVEEEMLNEKLQTAGFFLSMPEEEQIKKRLLEIKQMRENPELFTPENTKVLTLTESSK